jgi:hypothetical protein
VLRGASVCGRSLLSAPCLWLQGRCLGGLYCPHRASRCRGGVWVVTHVRTVPLGAGAVSGRYLLSAPCLWVQGRCLGSLSCPHHASGCRGGVWTVTQVRTVPLSAGAVSGRSLFARRAERQSVRQLQGKHSVLVSTGIPTFVIEILCVFPQALPTNN